MLRTIAKLLLLFSPALTFAALPTKAVEIQNGYYTGSAYRTLPDDARMTYIAGVIDGYLYAPMFGADGTDMRPFAGCIRGMKTDQLMAIVDQYLANNPTVWDDQMNAVVDMAFRRACASRGRPYR